MKQMREMFEFVRYVSEEIKRKNQMLQIFPAEMIYESLTHN